MDNYTIFTKTAKGLGEALGKTKNLSREQRKILKEIDGKASFEDLVEQIGMDESKLEAVVNKLLADDYIREFGSSAPPGARPSGETVFDLTSPGMIEVANSQLTIGDFFRAMETPPTQSGGAGVDFRNLGQPEAEIARKTLEQTAAQVDEIRRAIEEEAQRITARTQQQAAEAARREAEAKARQEAELARQQAMAQEQARIKAKQEAEEQARQAAQEQARKAAEEAERQAARVKAEQEARRLAEEAARREADERARREAEEQARRQAEDAARKLAQEQARRQAEEQARIKAEQEARVAAEARAREAAAEQERARLQAEEEARRVAQARAREEAEVKARREAEEQVRRQQEEEARRLADEEARKQAQEQARIKAREAARRAAEEMAEREAQAKARAEAERLAQIRAEEEARQAAEAKARRQAEEAARLAAEEQAQREAEEQARLRAEEDERRDAEEKARREAEELAKKEAQERARQEAEEAARLKAEEKARQKAEAKAKKEAEAQAKREAREQARREAEEKARQEAERKAQLAAEEKARKEAEAKARHEAKEKARQAAEEAARQKAEAAARLKAEKEAEKAAREAANAAAKEAAKGLAGNAAEEAGTTETTAIAAGGADSQAPQSAEDTVDAALPETTSSFGGMRNALPSFSLGKLVRVGAVALAALSVAGLGLIHIVPFNGRLAQLEQQASAQFGKPVKIDSLNLSLLPQPHWRLQQVSIGADKQIVIPQVKATAAIGSLFTGAMQFNSVELVSPVIDEEGLGWILFGQTAGASWQVTSLNASQVRLRMQQVQVPLFNASAEFDDAGAWRKMVMNAAQEKLHVDLARAEGSPRFEFTANDLVLPFGGTLAFDTLNASGTVERDGLDIGKFSAIIYDGTVSGSATLRWQDGWSLKGTAQARHVAPVRLAPGVFQGGTLEGNFSYAMQSAEAARLLSSPQARGSFSVNGGALTGVDMASHVMGQAGSGKTAFNELNGDFTYDGGKVKLSRMRLAAGLLSAGGDAAVDSDGKLNGHVTVDLRTASRQAHSSFNIGGTPAEPKFSR
jgi:hypothetical protein